MRYRSVVCIAALLSIVLFGSATTVEFYSQASARTQLNVLVPVRDGERLAVDIYLPEGAGPFPVLFCLTPYNKSGQAENAKFYVSHGYAVVVADSRGIYGSHGEWTPYMNDGRDGYDLQQWIGSQPWSNGKIGMFGRSYPGFTQLLPAPYRSPFVKAIMPEAAQSDNFGSIWSTNGLYHLALGLSWASRQEAIATEKPAPQLNWMKLMWHLPLKDVTQQIGVHSKFLMDTLSHSSYDDFWKAMSVRHLYSEMDVPAFHLTGWYDDLTAETLLNYTSMRKHSRSQHARNWQKLLVGPWGHGVRSNPQYGDMDFGLEMAVDLRGLHLRWFDYHLKGIQNGLDKEAPVRIFVMGANKWRDEQEWPLSRARATQFYLHSKGFANSRFGDGVLTTQAPVDETPDRFRYDPRNPVPTYGGHGCCGGGLTPDGPLDQRVTQQRPDVLVYTSDPLDRDTEVTGPIEVQLFFSTDVRDTDLFATLSDVHPDGRTILITEGAVRTRFRDSLEKPTLLTPNQVYEAKIQLWETSNVF
ncbi:MAG: CocE/NonD family hydrolase [Acidobacteria bacterium]|nr:CocE/NonD family hydrolase [Acidobacteriota bacterium]